MKQNTEMEKTTTHNNGIVFEFSTWGQVLTTTFATEEEAWKWIWICYDKGFFWPLTLVYQNGVLIADEQQILDRLDGGL